MADVNGVWRSERGRLGVSRSWPGAAIVVFRPLAVVNGVWRSDRGGLGTSGRLSGAGDGVFRPLAVDMVEGWECLREGCVIFCHRATIYSDVARRLDIPPVPATDRNRNHRGNNPLRVGNLTPPYDFF